MTPKHLIAASCIFCAGTASATGVTAQLGTTGLGASVTVPVHSNVNARFGANALGYSGSASTPDVEYDYKLKLRAIDALLDWHPTASTFRITTGVVYNGNRLDLLAKPQNEGSYVFRGTTYDLTEVGEVDGRVDFRKLAPYLGIGWSKAATNKTGWGFSIDLGVFFHGTPRASLTAARCTSVVPGLCDRFRSDVEAEEAELREKIKDLKAYPVLRLGLNYRF
jgi:hypothetical protein